MSNQDINKNYQYILSKLKSVRRNWRYLLFCERLLILLSTLALVSTFVLICFQFPLPYILRISIVSLSTILVIYLTIRILIRPLLRKLTYATVAAYLEKTYTNIENRIISAVQLKPVLDDNKFGYAQEFIEQLLTQTYNDMENIKTKNVFRDEYAKIKRNAGFTGIAFGILFISYFFLPTSLKGITQTFESIPKTAQTGFTIQIEDIQPGNIQIKQGDDVKITASVSGHMDAPVNLIYQVAQTNNNAGVDTIETPSTDNKEWQSLTMIRESIDSPYAATLQSVNRSMQYYISTKDVDSQHYEITVGFDPVVKSFQVQINYPEYTQLDPKILDQNIGDIRTLYGSEIVVTGSSNKSLSEANLVFEDLEPVKLAIQENTTIQGSFIAKQADRYNIQILDTDNLTNVEPLTYTLDIFKDTSPQVAIIEPGEDRVLDDDMLVELKVETTDDYGIQAVELVYAIQKENANNQTVTLKRIPSDTTPPQSSIFLTYTWDIDPIGLFPGESISYYVQAIDTDNVSGPNIGKSRTYILRFPTLDELYEELSVDQETEQTDIDDLFEEQSDATEAVDRILDKIRKFREFSITDKKQMQQVIENQKDIEQKANELLSKMQQTTSEMEKNQLFDPDTIQKYQELQDLMKEALSEEHQELLKKLSEALAQQELSEQEQAATEANFNQEQFQQQLERLKSLYQQLILQQKLEAAAKQSKALAEEQKQLIDSIQQPPDGVDQETSETQTAKLNDAANNEDRIQNDSNNLSKKLDELGNEMSELFESQDNPAPQLKKIADEVKRLNQYTRDEKLPENLQQTTEYLRNAEQQEAVESGRNAEQTMTELAQGLDNAMEFFEGANSNEALTAMKEAVKSGLSLSHLHEKVIDNTRELVTTNPGDYIKSEILKLQQLAANELSAAKGIEQLADKLWELGKQQIQVDPKIVWQMNSGSDALRRAARALEDRQAMLAIPIQQTGLADINQAVFDLLIAISQMNQQMGAGGLENMMEQLEQLAQSQDQLNQMAQTLRQQMRERGETPGLQQRLERIASQQQLIREATERLAEIAEKAAEMLGSLQDVAEEMKEVERKLQEGILDEDVINQQERIVTRMLDSLKSLHQRDLGKKRKAQVAKKNMPTAKDVPALHPQLLEFVRKLETTPNAKEFENIPFQYREQLRQYFKALSTKTVK
ncbi:hypothetical protein JT359_05620 [Candidatus Poribacteria bacterium]|nr:hypothetical protein [Candidatus Poribacteria bacterium]